MLTIQVKDKNNKAVGEVEVTPTVFDRKVKRSLLHEAVVQYQAGKRQGTHSTKARVRSLVAAASRGARKAPGGLA